MPEPLPAAHDSQGAKVANAPQQSATDKPTTAPLPDKNLSGFMDALGLPPEIQARITPKPEPQPTPEPPVVEPETPLEQPEAISDETEGEDPDEIEETEQQVQGQEPQKVDKRQKRINRLTRKVSEAEAKSDAYAQEIARLQSQIGQSRPQVDPVQVAFSGPTPWMPDAETAQSYQKVSAEVQKANALIAWCDENPNGSTTVNAQGQQEVIEPERVEQWRRIANSYLAPAQAERVVLEREAKRTFKAAKAQYDAEARQAWPEIFDPRTPEHQAAMGLFQAYPWLNGLPDAAIAAGLIVEGRKSWQARVTKNGNGNIPQHKDLDPRGLGTPRVPIAPHTAEPPGREAKRSSQQGYNDAMAKHIADPDGNHLRDAFSALDAAKRSTVTSRSPVKS